MSGGSKPVRKRAAHGTVAKRVSFNLSNTDADRLQSIISLVETDLGQQPTMSKLYGIALALLDMRLKDSSSNNALWLFRV